MCYSDTLPQPPAAAACAPPSSSQVPESPSSLQRAAHQPGVTMRLQTATLLLAAVALPADAQFFNAIRNIFRPATNLFQGAGNIFGGGGGSFSDDGTQRPQSTGKEELFPTDCGRNTDSGTGKLCFPDGLLCRDSK